MKGHPPPSSKRFLIRRQLGAGGFGVVYQAYDRERKTEVALKTLWRSDPDTIYRFKQEFRSLAGVIHPNLVRIYELGREEETWFFTMELIEGIDFVSYVRGTSGNDDAIAMLETGDWMTAKSVHEDAPKGEGDPRPPLDEAGYARLYPAFRQLVAGVQALHAAGMLHRDIKPSNVLVDREGRVVLLDFGLVAELSLLPGEISSQDRLLGTVGYMSPEQAAAAPLSPASDWYSVGVILFEVLTGRLPFPGKGIGVLLEKQRSDPPDPLDSVPDIPPDLAGICRALLCREPEGRPGGAALAARLAPLAPIPSASPPPPPDSVPPSDPIVGREEEIALLMEAFREMQGNRTVVVRIEGESGIGKTTLVRAFLAEVGGLAPDTLILTGKCFERESIPFKAMDPVIDLLTRHLSRLGTSEIQALLPEGTAQLVQLFPVLRRVEGIREHATGMETADPQVLRRTAFTALRTFLRRLAQRRPLILFIDDLQWGDEDSFLLLADLLRPPDPPPFFLLLAHRNVGTDAPITTILPPETRRHLTLREIVLPPLRTMACCDLLARSFAFEPPLAEAITKEGGGNPFLIEMLARYAREHADRLSAPSDALSFRKVLSGRLADLPEAGRNVLEIIAVFGRPIPLSLLCELLPPETDFDTIDRLGRLKWVRTTQREGADTLDIYHDRIRETLLSLLSEEKKREIHRSLARMLESIAPEQAEALSRLFEGGGEREKAARYAREAANRAFAALAFDRAAFQLRRAITLDPERHDTWELRARLAEALFHAGKGVESAWIYLEAAARCPERTTAFHFRRLAAEQFLQSGHLAEGRARMEEIVEAAGMKLSRHPRRTILLVLLRAHYLSLRGLHFKERSEDEVPPEDLLRMDVCRSVALGMTMWDAINAVNFAGRMLLLALRRGEPTRLAIAMTLVANILVSRGSRRIQRIRRLLAAAEPLAQKIGRPDLIGRVHLSRGLAAYYMGKWTAARAQLEAAEQIFRTRCSGVFAERTMAQLFTIGTLFYLGELHELSQRLPLLIQEVQERNDRSTLVFLHCWRALVELFVSDDETAAREEIATALALWPPVERYGFHIQHYWGVRSGMLIDLYAGKPAQAAERLATFLPAIRNALILLSQMESIQIHYLSACARIAQAHGRRLSTWERL
ncbi:MAG: hypothetical protein D6795_13405, partial [Deltaproteobacteria bacterium]